MPGETVKEVLTGPIPRGYAPILIPPPGGGVSCFAYEGHDEFALHNGTDRPVAAMVFFKPRQFLSSLRVGKQLIHRLAPIVRAKIAEKKRGPR